MSVGHEDLTDDMAKAACMVPHRSAKPDKELLLESDASAAHANSDDGHLEVGAETSKVDEGTGGLAPTRRLDTVLALRPIARSAFLVHVDDRDSQTTRRDHARRARGDG